jgi:serralysin
VSAAFAALVVAIMLSIVAGTKGDVLYCGLLTDNGARQGTNGVPTTLNGTKNKGLDTEALDGTTGPDVITGRQGKDAIHGYQGNDTLCGDDAGDEISGGSGNDALYGGQQSDRLDGADGNDTLVGDPVIKKPDRCKGHTKKNECASDRLDGGDGGDFLVVRAGSDKLYGGKGYDVCRAHTAKAFRGGCEKKQVDYSDGGGGGGGAATPTTTTVNAQVNHLKDLVHVWGTTTPHTGTDTVYVVIQHKGAGGDWGRVKWGCFGFGSDGRFAHDFALSPARNYRVEARYGAPECAAVAYLGSSSDVLYFDVD